MFGAPTFGGTPFAGVVVAVLLEVVTPAWVTTSVAFSPGVSPGAVTSGGSTVAATTQVFAPTLAVGAVEVVTPQLASSVTLAAPTVAAGAVSITAGTVASTVTLAAAAVAPGAVEVAGPFIGGGGGVFAPSVVPDAVGITGAFIDPAVALSPPTVEVPAVQAIEVALLPSTLVVLVPEVFTGDVPLVTGTVLSTVVVHAPVVAHLADGATINSGSGTFAPDVALTVEAAHCVTTTQLFEAAVEVPPTQAVDVAFCESALVLFGPAVSPGGAGIETGTVGSTLVVFAPALAPGAVEVETGALPTAVALFPPTIGVDAITVVAGHVESETQLFPLAIAPGEMLVVAGTVGSTLSLAAPSVAHLAQGATIGSTTAVFFPSVSLAVTLAHRPATAQLFAPTVAVLVAQNIGTGALPSAAVLTPPSVVSLLSVITTPVPTTAVVHAPALAYRVLVAHLAGESTAHYPSVLATWAVTGAHVANTIQVFPAAVEVPAVQTIGAAFSTSASRLYAPAITPPITLIAGGTRPSTAQVFAPAITTYASSDGTFIASGARLFAPRLAIDQFVVTTPVISGTQVFAPSALATTPVGGGTITNTSLLFPASVAVGPATIRVVPVWATTVLFAPTVGAGPVAITAGHAASMAVAFSPTVETTTTTYAAHIPAAVQLFAPVVAVGPVTVQTAPLASTGQLFAPTLGIEAGAGTIASAAQLFAPSLSGTVTTPAWVSTTVLFPGSVVPLTEVDATFILSGSVLLPPFMVAYGKPSEIFDFVSNIVTAIGGDCVLCRDIADTVMLTRGVTKPVEINRRVDMSPSLWRVEFVATVTKTGAISHTTDVFVTLVSEDANLCRGIDDTVILTRGVTVTAEMDHAVEMSATGVRREFAIGVER